MKPKLVGTYKSTRDIDLVSHVPNVITCENGTNWSSLYYITSDGYVVVLSDKYDTFYEEVKQYKHSFEPKSVVDFAIYHGLKIGLESYKAMCYMYAKECEYKKNIPNTHLPSMDELCFVIVEDYGNWSNCFARPLLCKNFKYAKEYNEKWSPVQIGKVVLDYGEIKVIRNNDYMYSILSDNKMYLIHTLDRLGEGIHMLLRDKFNIALQEEQERCSTVLDKVTKASMREISIDNLIKQIDGLDGCDREDILKYYVPSFIDVYRKNAKLSNNTAVSFPLAVCRDQTSMLGNAVIPTDVYDQAIEEFNELGNSRYLSATAYENTESVADMLDRYDTDDDEKESKDGLIERYLNGEELEEEKNTVSDIVGTILEITNDRIYVKITNASILNKVLQPDNLYHISVKMTYILRSISENRRKGNHVVCDELDIIGFEITDQPAGNPRYYFDVECR